MSSGASDNDLTLPELSCSDNDGTVYNRFRVPVAGDQIHVLVDHYPAVVDGEGSTGARKFFLHGNIPWVRGGLVCWNTGNKLHDLLVGARRMEVIRFVEFYGLCAPPSDNDHERKSRTLTVLPIGRLRRSGIGSRQRTMSMERSIQRTAYAGGGNERVSIPKSTFI